MTLKLSAIAGIPVVTPVTPSPTNYVPTFTGLGTVTNINVNWSQSGTRCKVWGTFKTGTVTGVLAKMSLPSSPSALNINSTYHVQSQNVLGYGSGNTTSASGVLVSGVGLALIYDSTDAASVFFAHDTDTLANDKAINAQNGNVVFNSNSRFVFSFEYEIAGASGYLAYGQGQGTFAKPGLNPALSALGNARLNTSSGYGSTNTTIRRIITPIASGGTGITVADSTTLGCSITATEAGIYTITYTDEFSAGASMGLSKNSSQLTTNIAAITAADRLGMTSITAANTTGEFSWTGPLAINDVVRPHSDATTSGSSIVRATLTIQQLFKF